MRSIRRFSIAFGLLAVAGLQLTAAGVDFRAIVKQLNNVMRKEVDKKAPTPEVDLDPVPIGKPGQRLDLTIPGKAFANDAKVYFPDPFVDHIAQKVISGSSVSATIALAADVWSGLIPGVIVNPSSAKKVYFDAVRVPGRLELDLKAENGLRIRVTQIPRDADGVEDRIAVEFFKPGSSAPFMKGEGTFSRYFDDGGGPSATMSSLSEEPPPCTSFDIDGASVGPGKPTFIGRLVCDDPPEMKMTGSARRLQ
jgi:hypothetical protein